MESRRETRDDLILSEPELTEEVITADLSGTPATIIDTTTYPVADQDGLTSVITVNGVEQTVTFSGATTTAASVAAQMNAQLSGCYVEESGGQVKITTDETGPTASLAAAAGTGGLTWDTPVAGTGDPATWPKGTMLARNSSTLKLEKYSDTGTLDRDNPRRVLPHELTFAASGDLATQVLVGGKVNQNRLSKLGDSSPIGQDVIEKLIANSNIVPQTVRNTSVFDD